jgi:hypothetical protein
MIRLVFCCLIAALFSSSCVLDNEKKKPDHVSFHLDPVLLGLTRVEIFRLDAKGAPIAPALFNDSLRAFSDVVDLDARGYGGGPAVFSVKGYKALELVYEIKVTFTGSATTVQDIKLIPLYSLAFKIADPVDRDKDGYQSGFRLVTGVKTNLGEDSLLLKFFWKKEGATTWESRGENSRLRISRASTSDTVSAPMEGGKQAGGTFKVEAYNRENLLVAEKTLNVREETADQDDPGFHFRLINQTGAYLDADITVSGEVETRRLAPLDTFLVQRDSRPASCSYFASASGDAVIWEDDMAMTDRATYEATLILSGNTDEFFVLNVTNNSTTAVDRIVVDPGLATESSAEGGTIPPDGTIYNAGVFNYSPTAKVYLVSEATGRVATLSPLQFGIDPDYGYRYANVVLGSSNWADPLANLFNKNWKLTGSKIKPGVKDSTGALFTDVYARMSPCNRDGFTTFSANGTFIDNEGPTKCDAADPQTTKGTWTLNANRTLLTLLWEGNTTPSEFKLEALTPTLLEFSDDKQTWEDGKVHKLTYIFSAP